MVQRLSEITDVQERQHALNYLARPDRSEVSPVKILYYGHSFVAHMQDYMATLPLYMNNFGIDYQEAVVYYKSKSGATIDRLRKKSQVDKILKMQPEIVVLEAGTNDLAKITLSPAYVCDQMMDLVRDMLDCRVREVIVSQVLLRGEEGLKDAAPHFEDKVYSFNHKVEDALRHLPRASYWHHRNLWKDIEGQVEDGTHLNDVGHKKLYRSLRGALQSTVNRIRPGWANSASYY